jgi:hypothetical protein
MLTYGGRSQNVASMQDAADVEGYCPKLIQPPHAPLSWGGLPYVPDDWHASEHLADGCPQAPAWLPALHAPPVPETTSVMVGLQEVNARDGVAEISVGELWPRVRSGQRIIVIPTPLTLIASRGPVHEANGIDAS